MPGIRSGALGAIAAALLCGAPFVANGAVAGPPEPELRSTPSVVEAELAGLPPGDPRRGGLLAQLAVRRHLDANDTSAPRADALRGEAVSWAVRALDEGTAAPELPDALIAGGIDADRLGRWREALRLLGTLVRRFPSSGHLGDAWLAIGEHHLRNGDLIRARASYDEAERVGRAPVRAWAVTRLSELQARVGAGTAPAVRPSVPSG